MGKHVLILGNGSDEHGAYVFEHLKQRGVAPHFLDSLEFPQSLRTAYDPKSGEGFFRFSDGERVPFSDIISVYWRNYNKVPSLPLPDEYQAFIAQNDARGLFESLLIQLPIRWVNGWKGFQLHQRKPAAMAIVRELGLQTVKIPETLLTNDLEACREFYETHPKCIFKPVQGGAHTRRVEARHLTPEAAHNLKFAPVTLQEEIPGTNVRVFVAGDEVVACEIATEAVDFRDDQKPDIKPLEVSFELKKEAKTLANALHLLWSGVDFRVTPEGDFYYLEANPSPMFMGFERYSGLPLTDLLLNLLTKQD